MEKDDLVNEANKAIEDFQENEHDVKAKMKHLIQAYVLNRSQSADQSSYKGDDSSLSLPGCFDQLQNVLANADRSAGPRPTNSGVNNPSQQLVNDRMKKHLEIQRSIEKT